MSYEQDGRSYSTSKAPTEFAKSCGKLGCFGRDEINSDIYSTIRQLLRPFKPPGPVLKGVVNKSMEFWRRAAPTADDSGIDSDDEHRVVHNLAFVNDIMQTTESSSSEEDGFRFRFRMPQVLPKFRRYREYGNNNECCTDDVQSDDNAATQQREDANLVRTASCELLNDFPSLDLDTPSKTGRHSDDDIRSENGRDSPSLLEVELTASDEDDEASVLELVIPMKQNMRYQRVPSNTGSNPKKRSACVFWIAFLCCVPRRLLED